VNAEEWFCLKMTDMRKMAENITAPERFGHKRTALVWYGFKRESYYPKFDC
jgi:hypothetical protein